MRASSAASFSFARARSRACTSYSSRVTRSSFENVEESIPRKFFSRSFAGLFAASAARRAARSVSSFSFISIRRTGLVRRGRGAHNAGAGGGSDQKERFRNNDLWMARLLLFPTRRRNSQPAKDTNMHEVAKALCLAGAAALTIFSTAARADDPPAEHTFTGKLGLWSEYEY